MAARHRLAVVLACGGRKVDHPAPALQLYTGRHFAAARRWALSVAEPASVYVLSSKYGLVTGDSELVPYGLRLAMPERAVDRLASTSWQLGQLVRHQARLLGLVDHPGGVWFVGRSVYLDVLHAGGVTARSVTGHLPQGRKGQGIGGQLAWLAANQGRLPPLQACLFRTTQVQGNS
jgi:hypothetical protein